MTCKTQYRMNKENYNIYDTTSKQQVICNNGCVSQNFSPEKQNLEVILI